LIIINLSIYQFRKFKLFVIRFDILPLLTAIAYLFEKIGDRDLLIRQNQLFRVYLSGTDVVKAIAQLDTQPQRLERISRRNVANCLLKHDWS
jgi:hypothetical protein